MNNFRRIFAVVLTSFLMISCGSIERPKDHSYYYSEEYLSQYPLYSEIEPKDKEPKATLKIVKVGDDKFMTSMQVLGMEQYKKEGKYHFYRLPNSPKIESNSDFESGYLPPDYIKTTGLINIKANQIFGFSASATNLEVVKTSWFRPDIKSLGCKLNHTIMLFYPKEGHNYLLSLGIKPKEKKDTYSCIFKLQEWDKNSKTYQDVPMIPYGY